LAPEEIIGLPISPSSSTAIAALQPLRKPQNAAVTAQQQQQLNNENSAAPAPQHV